MCGIAGGLALRGGTALDEGTLRRMLALLRHRGPEAAGIFSEDAIALGHARLSIVDLETGRQPIPNEDASIWVSVNGEVFNYPELRADLIAAGHRFRTRSDSEVIVHLYEDLGPALLERLNGQYAFALWDGRRRELLLARDRLGVRPLFYTVVGRSLLFASEAKALFADARVPRRPDLAALDQVFTYWSALSGRTVFEQVRELPAASYLIARADASGPEIHRYWSLRFDPGALLDPGEDHAALLRALLVDATRLRLRADVPVGAYLSGGLDSAAVTAVAVQHARDGLETFSVAFEDPVFDERIYQQQMARALGTRHHVVQCRRRDIAAVFPEVVWHAETPLLRSAPAPLYLLSGLVQRHGLKVVLTGEGADELFAGYDIFKEALVRRFWARRPESRWRPRLLRRLYGWIPDLQRTPQAQLEAFFGRNLDRADDPAFSHLLRWANTGRLKRLLSTEVRAALAGYDSRSELDALLDPDVGAWDTLSKAQHVEIATFLTPYLLSSQGDRMAMAHSVEGRFPFLDHRVAELAARIPPQVRMAGLKEKHVLKRAVGGLVPPGILERPKQPYRAPITSALCAEDAPDYVAELLDDGALRAAGLFDVGAVRHLRAKCAARPAVGETDAMGLAAVVSGQLWHQQFMTPGRFAAVAQRADVVRVGADGALGAEVRAAPAGAGGPEAGHRERGWRR